MILSEISQIMQSAVKSSVSLVDFQLNSLKKMASAAKGNAKHLLTTQSAWMIPLTWLGTYAPIYMRRLGLSSSDIGNLASLGMSLGAIFLIAGGYFTEKWGHKRTVMTFDLISWPAAMLIFALAQNIWWFIAGTFVVQFSMAGSSSWNCLFVEDAPKSKRAHLFTILQIINVAAGLAMPAAGMIIAAFGELHGIRLLYIIGGLSMCAGWAWRQAHLKETEAGKKHAVHDLDFNFNIEFLKFREGLAKLKARKSLFLIFAVQVLIGFGFGMWNTMYVIYLTDSKGLALNSASITVFPLIYSVTLVAVSLIVIPLIKQKDYTRAFKLVNLAPVASVLLLLAAPKYDMSFVVVSSILNGIHAAFFLPFASTYMFGILSEKERARSLSVIYTLITASMIPAGSLAGYAYRLAPKLVFECALVLFIISVYLVFAKLQDQPAARKLDA